MGLRSYDVLLHTPQITLRRLHPDDLAAFQIYRHDQALARYQGWTVQADEAALDFLVAMAEAPLFRPGHWIQLGMADPLSNLLIGDLGVFLSDDQTYCTIGFTLSRPWQRRGIASEALNILSTILFTQTPIQRIEASADMRNTPSWRLLERCGFRRIDARDAFFKGEWCTEYLYTYARLDYEASTIHTLVSE
ncbi:GNAT family N-acetyltransferase [Burkholderiaceae bacterium DAT-1]|nr:GNAT family N-acetyltransferase [Burkholderiaceae bacterium DAT-1]